MINYPLHFTALAAAAQGTQEPWAFQSYDNRNLACVPVEFGGGGGGFSPEDLFAQALTNCFVATLQVYSKASKVTFGQVTVKSSLTVDKNELGNPCMQGIHLAIELQGVERPDRMKTLVEKSLRSGFVLNSVKTKIDWSLKINGELA